MPFQIHFAPLLVASYSGRRTAVGKFGGSLAGVPAFALGAAVIKQLLEDQYKNNSKKLLACVRLILGLQSAALKFACWFPCAL